MNETDSALRLCCDLRSMLADGELDRAEYNVEDVRDAIARLIDLERNGIGEGPRMVHGQPSIAQANDHRALEAAVAQLTYAFDSADLDEAKHSAARLIALLDRHARTHPAATL